jgi:hypothetical protein
MVDFDATLCSWSYPGMGEPEPGARDFMVKIFDMGLLPVIWSCRMSPAAYSESEIAQAVTDIGTWAAKHDIPYHTIDTGQSGKALCLAYVDDRGVAYRNNFDSCLWDIHRLMLDEEVKSKAAPA